MKLSIKLAMQSIDFINKNLASIIFTTISSQLLPYLLNIETCCGLWKTFDKRLESINNL